jgi:hypothetical protein
MRRRFVIEADGTQVFDMLHKMGSDGSELGQRMAELFMVGPNFANELGLLAVYGIKVISAEEAPPAPAEGQG